MVLLLVGSAIGQSTTADATLKHIGVFSDVVGYIKDQYVEEPDMKSVTLGALTACSKPWILLPAT
jgi:carboxyl-terminal processing protease